MERTFRRGIAVILLAAGAMLTGCQSGRMQAERDSLWRQNQQLQNDMARAAAERDALIKQRDQAIANQRTLQQRLNALGQELGLAQQAAANARTGFDQIAGIETESTPERITVRVPGDVLFASGQIDLRSTSKSTLAQIAAVISRDYGDKTIRIEGYTDSDPIRRSQWKDNLELSLQRAAAVHRYLQSQGVRDERMYAAGFGPARPRATKTKSRRVEIVVVLTEQMAGSNWK